LKSHVKNRLRNKQSMQRVDSRATGVVLTPAYVKVVQLQLENMGTEAVKLIQLETKCMPLLSEASCDKWVHGHGTEWKSIKEELYSDKVPAKGDSSPAVVPVPSGLVALWILMTSSRKARVGSSPFVPGALGELIGFGAFATVDRATDNDNRAIKVSRYGAKATLDREAKVLKALQEQMSPVGIASFIDYKKLSVTIGCVDVQLPALILAPRAK